MQPAARTLADFASGLAFEALKVELVVSFKTYLLAYGPLLTLR
jgi:hypothetical protein